MKKISVIWFVLFISSVNIFSQNISYKTTIIDSIILKENAINKGGFINSTLQMNSKNIFYYNKIYQKIYKYTISGTLIDSIVLENISKRKLFVYGISANENNLDLLSGSGIYYRYNLENNAISKITKAEWKYKKMKVYPWGFWAYNINKNFIHDIELKKFVFAHATEYQINKGKSMRKLLKKDEFSVSNALSLVGVVNEQGNREFMFPMLESPYSFYMKFFTLHLHPTFAYNAQKKLYYFSTARNHDILAVNLMDYSHFSFGEKVKSIKFVPPKDTSSSAFDSLMTMNKNLYLVEKMQRGGRFWGLRYDSHYTYLFRTYSLDNAEYRKLYDEHMSKVSWNQCGLPKLPFKWLGEKYKLYTQVYTPEGKYLGTIKDHERYTPLMDDVIYQEGNTYWVRGPIKNGKWTIYKMKMDLEVESLEKQ